MNNSWGQLRPIRSKKCQIFIVIKSSEIISQNKTHIVSNAKIQLKKNRKKVKKGEILVIFRTHFYQIFLRFLKIIVYNL